MAANLKLISFNPNPELSPFTNLKRFVAYCRDELTLWSDGLSFDWDGSSWPVGHSDRHVRFTNLANSKLHPSIKPTSDQLLHPRSAGRA